MTEDSIDGTGLMAFWATIDEDYLHRFREWHTCEHMPERVSIPGFQVGRRYIDCGDPATYLMTYQTNDSAVLGSPPYLDALNAPSDWTRESLPHFRKPVRNIYSRLAAHGETDYLAAPYVYTLRFNADGDGLAEAAAALAGDEQLGRVALYQVDEAISGIQTSETQDLRRRARRATVAVVRRSNHGRRHRRLGVGRAAGGAVGGLARRLPGPVCHRLRAGQTAVT